MIISDLNFTRLIFDCNGDEWNGSGGSTGGGGGGGGGGSSSGDGQVTLINYPSPEPTIDNSNLPPVAQDDGVFNVPNSNSVFSIGIGQSILLNDSDCMDNTDNRLSNSQSSPPGPCAGPGAFDNNNIDDITSGTNGDGITARTRTNVTTEQGGRITINSDGTFSYNPSSINADVSCLAETVTDRYRYQVRDGRGASDSAFINFSVTLSGDPNNPPERRGRDTILAEVDTANNSSVGGSTSQFDDLFYDVEVANGTQSLSYSAGSVQGYSNSLFTVSGGSWNFNIPQSAIDAPDGTVTEIRINVNADDGGDRCNEGDNRFVIRVIGSGDPPPPPEETDEPDDPGGGFGSCSNPPCTAG